MDEIQVAVFRWPGPEAHPTPGKKDRVCRTVVRRLACLLSFILSAVPALTAQSFDERFSDCFSKGDTAAARRVLRQWEASAERPAEFFVVGLNDCFRMARQSLTVSGDSPGDGNGPTLETVDSTGSCRELSLSEAVRYGTALVRRGIAYVDRGIEAYPSRAKSVHWARSGTMAVTTRRSLCVDAGRAAGSARYDDTGRSGRVARSAGRPSGRGDLLSQNGGLRGRFRPGLRFAAALRVGGERVIFRGYGYGRCAGGFARNAFRSRGKSAGIVRWASEFYKNRTER